MECIRVNLFKNSESFIEMLKKGGIEYGEVQTYSTVPMASGIVLMIYGVLQTAAPWGALATILVAWMQFRSTRKVIITTKENQVIHIEGFSVEEIAVLLSETENLSIIDSQPESKAS